MKTLIAAVAGALLAVPAFATTYSGTGSWVSIQPGSDYSATDTITWSFTTGALVPQLFGSANFVTAFSFTIGTQSWTMADAINTPINFIGTIDPIFVGVNSQNTYLYTGIYIDSKSSYPSPYFIVGNVGVGPGPLDSNGVFAANNGLGEFTAIGSLNAAVIPEPASWALLIAGFGLTGAAMRRRRIAVTA
jgi:hypothetical protein